MGKIFDPKITPGDWNGGLNTIRDNSGNLIATIQVGVGRDVEKDRSIANTRAIAAIPEMLALIKAARRLEKALDALNIRDDEADMAYIALVKARHNLDEKHGREIDD